MGVYVKGMEMPNKCFDCPFCKCIGYNPRKEHGQKNYVDYKRLGRVYIDAFEVFILSNCPLVEVPEPHGRLIDADVLCERLMVKWPTADESGRKIIPEVMDDVVTPIVVGTPTVIEEEGE